jgi:hypothetical protein
MTKDLYFMVYGGWCLVSPHGVFTGKFSPNFGPEKYNFKPYKGFSSEKKRPKFARF